MPKQGKDRKDIAEIHIPQSVDELKIDSAFAERYYYLLKCLRERGVYVMLDIFTSRGLMTEAVNAKDYPRFQMFDNPVYQKHWKTAFDFLLKKPNPYTGKALIDDIAERRPDVVFVAMESVRKRFRRTVVLKTR